MSLTNDSNKNKNCIKPMKLKKNFKLCTLHTHMYLYIVFNKNQAQNNVCEKCKPLAPFILVCCT